jgi:hypothetical protein
MVPFQGILVPVDVPAAASATAPATASAAAPTSAATVESENNFQEKLVPPLTETVPLGTFHLLLMHIIRAKELCINLSCMPIGNQKTPSPLSSPDKNTD